MTRYFLHPGLVVSMDDAQRHWVGAAQLHQLYGVPVPLWQCVIVAASSDMRGYQKAAGDIHLFPRASGDYALPTS